MWSKTVIGRSGNSHGCSGAGGGRCLVLWQFKHSFTLFSKSLSIPDHHTKLWARLFICKIPGWISWSSLMTCCRPHGGTTTRLPQRIQPLSMLSSFLHCWNGFRELSEVSLQRWRIKPLTLTMDHKLSIVEFHCFEKMTAKQTEYPKKNNQNH